MLQKNKRFIGILCICISILFPSMAGYAETEEHVSHLVWESADGGWCLVLRHLPLEIRDMALLFSVSAKDGENALEMNVCEDVGMLTLTVGKPSDGWVSVLIDGRNFTHTQGAMRLLFVAGDTPPTLSLDGGGLWIKAEDGRVAKYPLTVSLGEPETLVDTEETDGKSESFSESETCSDTDKGESTEEESHVFEVPPVDTESLADDEDSGGTAVKQATLYLGCRETSPKDGCFSVRLLFWRPADAPLPTVVFMGGGQEVGMTVERLGKSSVVAITYRALSANGTCRFWVDTLDGMVEIRYKNGVFQEQTACR